DAANLEDFGRRPPCVHSQAGLPASAGETFVDATRSAAGSSRTLGQVYHREDAEIGCPSGRRTSAAERRGVVVSHAGGAALSSVQTPSTPFSAGTLDFDGF